MEDKNAYKRRPKVDLTGKQIGYWTAISYEGRGKWLCRCICGTERLLQTGQINLGTTHSCGCRKAERCAKTHYRHGMYQTKLYGVWEGMKGRCLYKKHQSYKNYGGRGISICQEWQSDFLNFYKWAIGSGYRDGLTLDRIDADGNYEPSNCRWATIKEQANNKRNSVLFDFNGERLTVSQISEKYGIPDKSIRYRLKKGMSITEAVESTIALKGAGKIASRGNYGKAKSSPKTERV